jgi:uncharacterized protein (DUF39 family)
MSGEITPALSDPLISMVENPVVSAVPKVDSVATSTTASLSSLYAMVENLLLS